MSMQNTIIEKKDDKIFSPQEIVFNLITLYYLDHKSICNFGATSKHNDRWMIDLAETRKKIFGTIPEIAQSSLQAWYYDAWHRYASAYRCMYVRSYAEQKLHAKSYELSFSLPIKREIHEHHTLNGQCIKPLPCKVLPYYNDHKDYFYGILTKIIPCQYRTDHSKDYKSISICRFIFDKSGLECRISISDEQSWGLRYFLDYPIILKAILASTIVSQKKKVYINIHGRRNKRAYWDYSLKGITIPENYQQYIKDIDSNRQTARWNLLDQSLKNAIEMRYQEQRSKIQ
jgi:hypothetical protein